MKNRIYALYNPAVAVIAAAMLSMCITASVRAAPAITFVDAAEAMTAALPAPPAPCAARLPVWMLALSDGTYSGFSTRKADSDCRGDFAKEVRDFTNEEKETLTRYATLIDSIAGTHFPALKRVPWSFVVISDSADFGVPVSDKHIILTKSLIADMREWMDKQTRLFFMGLEILIHERVRLLQLADPAPFEKFYRENWGFRKIPAPSIDSRMLRANGLYLLRVPEIEWVTKAAPRDKEHFAPALLLRDAGGKDAGTVLRVAITLDSTARGFVVRKNKNRRMPMDYKDLRFITQYRRKFPLSDYDYHPAELSADLLAKFLVIQYVSARYGIAAARVADYSQIDALIRMVGQ